MWYRNKLLGWLGLPCQNELKKKRYCILWYRKWNQPIKPFFFNVGRLPTKVYELVNKRTKFTVVYGRLPPIFGERVCLPVRLRRSSGSGLPNSSFTNHFNSSLFTKSSFPQSSFPTQFINSLFANGLFPMYGMSSVYECSLFT